MYDPSNDPRDDYGPTGLEERIEILETQLAWILQRLATIDAYIELDAENWKE
jgi:hypothetical protein